MTFANFKTDGNIPSEKERLIINTNTCIYLSIDDLRTDAFILSYPELVFLSLLITDDTSISVVGVRKNELLKEPSRYEFAEFGTLSILESRVGPTLTKKLLNLSAISLGLVYFILFYIKKDCLILVFFALMTVLSFCQVFLLFDLYFSKRFK